MFSDLSILYIFSEKFLSLFFTPALILHIVTNVDLHVTIALGSRGHDID